MFICDEVGEKNFLFLEDLFLDLSLDLSYGVLIPLKLKVFFIFKTQNVAFLQDLAHLILRTLMVNQTFTVVILFETF